MHSSASKMKVVTILVLSFFCVSARTQPPSGEGIDKLGLSPIQPFSSSFNLRMKKKCSTDYREIDGTCTNNRTRTTKLWGSTNRPQFSYFAARSTKFASGMDLPSPRVLSNLLSTQVAQTFDERGLNEMATFVGQFLDHTLVSTPTNSEETMPITVPSGEAAGGFLEKLPFKRSMRVRDDSLLHIERPQNTLTSVVDLANVYGPNKERSSFLRTESEGMMKTSDGNLLPHNTDFVNSPPNSGNRYFLAGDHRANEHPTLTSLHTLFVREHNTIAAEIKERFPGMGDELLFQNAKKINEAQWQKIVFEEWYPAITGRTLPAYRGFNTFVNPTVSLTFSTAAFRVGHTLVGNKVNRRGVNNSFLQPFTLVSMFFRERDVITHMGIEQFLRGAYSSRAQKVDLLVVDALRNFLFKGVEGESDNFDLVSLNLQRGRDHALPPYNAIRQAFDQPRAVSFENISTSLSVQSKLQQAYVSPDRIEAWPGLMAEDHVSGSSFGPTLLAIWEREFLRLRDGDRFFFRNKGVFSSELMELERVKSVLHGDNTFRSILIRNSAITNTELPQRMFFVD